MRLNAQEGRSYCYSVYGGVLRSCIEMPELREAADGPSDWSFEIAPGSPADVDSALLGVREIGSECYRLLHTEAGYRLEYSHAGTFDLCPKTGRIVWYRQASPVELVRTIVLGSAMAVLLEAAGLVCMHGSAVAIEGAAVVFIAPKHHGKSTFACALATRGARLISDDLVALDVSTGVSVRDGVASVRLWDDIVEALELESECERVLPGIKNTAMGFRAQPAAGAVTAVSAIYLMRPKSAADHPRLTRTAVTGADAVITLAQHTKLPTPLVGLSGAVTQLRLVGAVTACVPLYRLEIPADINLLPACIEQLLEWHAAPARASGGTRP